jgi:fibronectin-binding autotransporter adhesin
MHRTLCRIVQRQELIAMFRLRFIAITLVLAVVVAGSRDAVGQTNGTWNAASGGDWDVPASWVSSIADGVGATANFNTLDVNGPVSVTLSTPRTVGTLNFGDTAVGTPGGWALSGLDLTLAGASPTISVGALAPDNVVDLQNVIAGTAGFTKTGPGTLVLTADNNTPVNGLTGNIRVNEGALTIAGAYKTTQHIDMANGTVLNANAAVGDNPSPNPGVGGVRLAAGSTVTINNTNGSSMAGVSGTTATLNLNLGAITAGADQNWAGTGNMAAVNVTGTVEGSPGTLSLRFVAGNFNANSFSNTTVTLNNANLASAGNSGGNTVLIGALVGNATSALQGATGGTFVTYQVGGLNSSTTFEGNVATPANGLNLIKVGTGTLTLTGTLSYVPTTNVDVTLRGGLTRVEAGTLKLVGATAIPGGVDDATLSTIDLRANGTLDVSAATPTYSTATFQQIVGPGKVTGNYNHGTGILAPGDATVGVSQSLTATAGTMTFNNTLSFNGTGQINFDVSPSLTSGNDLIQVASADLTGTPVVRIGFLGGASTGAYTLLNSTAPLTGSLTGWTVLWEGRGAAPTLSQVGNQVKLNISSAAAGNLTWKGGVDGVWNAGNAGTANWRNNTTTLDDKYFQLDAVAFRDTYDGTNAPTNTTITLNAIVTPSAVVFNHSDTVPYAVSGTGRISGGTSLVKQGTGTLTLTTANNYSGGTTVSGGVIALGGTGMLGGGTVTLNGGAVHAGGAGNFNLPNNIVVTGTGNGIANSNTGAQTLNVQGVVSGSGALSLDNVNLTGTNGIDLHGVNTAFNGSVTVGATTSVFVRARNGQALGNGVAWDLGPNASTLASRIDNTPTSFQLGSLTGGALSFLQGHESGAGATSVNWNIGSLNTSTIFDGLIRNGGNTLAPTTRPVSITKVGTGTLTLTGFNTYTGMTRVLQGGLSLSQAYIGDTSDVFVLSSATLNLNFAGQDTVRSLFVNGVPQPAGTYNSSNSPFITGTGELLVTALGTITADFDGDFTVNGNDFLWIQRAGAPASVYTAWKAQFGTSPAVPPIAAVPEPATTAMAVVCAALASAARRRRSR